MHMIGRRDISDVICYEILYGMNAIHAVILYIRWLDSSRIRWTIPISLFIRRQITRTKRKRIIHLVSWTVLDAPF